MQSIAIAALLTGIFSLVAAISSGEETKQADIAPFQGKLVLFGACRGATQPGEVEIIKINPNGADLESVAKLADVGYMTGRISPNGRRLAFGTISIASKRWETWIWEAGEKRKLAGNGVPRAWSPDGASLVSFREKQGGGWESLRVDVATGTAEALPIPHTDVVDDWSPDGKMLLVMAGNSEHTFERSKDNFYPLRQIDLFRVGDWSRKRITNEPKIDAIWSRFSPDGTLVAHEQRTHEPAKVLECYMVRKSSGFDAVEIVRGDKLDENLREVTSYPSYPYFWYPHGAPCWSPDGSKIAVCLNNGKWRSFHHEAIEKWRWAIVFATFDGKIVNQLDLKDLGISWVGEIDWK